MLGFPHGNHGEQWGTVYLNILQKGIYMDLYGFLNDGDDHMGFLHVLTVNMIQVLSPQNNNTTNEHGDFS